MMGKKLFLLLVPCLTIIFMGCGSTEFLMDQPNLYSGENKKYLFADTPETLKTNPVDIIYVTDREKALDTEKGKKKYYSSNRSNCITIGEARVEMGWQLNWDELEVLSYEKFRDLSLPVRITNITEIAKTLQFPRQLFEKVYDKHHGEGAYDKAQETALKKFINTVDKKLKVANKKEVYIFLHGFNTSFNQGIDDWSQLWHFMGRTGVPIVYSWPAAAGGLKGYFADSQAGDASVAHLKLLLLSLSDMPEVEKIHLVGHSRGCDIIANTLTEMAIFNTAQSLEPGKGYNLGNIVLIAPDVDVNFMMQRVIGADVLKMPEKFSIFGAPKDRALALSEWLRSGMRRLGVIKDSRLTEEGLALLKELPDVNIIISEAKRVGINHSYYLKSSSVSSDIILLLRYNFSPGEMNGRPLNNEYDGIWNIKEGYPYKGYKLGDYINKEPE